jgi:hypothetical protein
VIEREVWRRRAVRGTDLGIGERLRALVGNESGNNRVGRFRQEEHVGV